LYKLRFKSHGSPEWSQQIAELLTEKHQIPTVCTDKRGLDHGCWAPLRLMFPGDAGSPFPVIQLSLNNTLDYEFHLRLGKALRELRQQGLVIIGSGGLVHNLGAICWDKPEGDSLPWVSKFALNIIQLSEQPGFDKLLLKFAQNHVAEIQQAHPRTEHFMPLFVTAGCVIDEEEHLKAVHDHTVYGTLRLTAFQTLQ
jgi:4,5-DOPA dioxygenase extradiol